MRILMLSWEYPPRIVGGISRVVHDLAQKLGEQGNEVHVITCMEHGAPDTEKDKNVYVHRVKASNINAYDFINWVTHLNFSLIERAVQVVNSVGNFDIIHAHDWVVAYAAKTLKSSYSIPLVSTIHATEHGRNWGLHNENQKYISSVEWWLGYESWKVIVNSYYMKNESKNVFQIPDDKIRIIHNGVDLNKFNGYKKDMDFRRRYVSDNEKLIFFVGRLVNEKGAHILIDAVPKILQYYNDAKIVIAGRGPQWDHLIWLVNHLNISHKVYLTGYISDEELLKLYKCADVAVFPSLYEPFGIVALEGMVANVPVVVSDTGGLGEIVEHGRDGLKAYCGNANSFADNILDILHNPVKAQEMAKRASEKVNAMYNWDIISKQTLNVYEDIIDESNRSGWKIQNIASKPCAK